MPRNLSHGAKVAASLRRALRDRLSLGRAEVSVTSKTYTLGAAVTVRCLDTAVDVAAVEDVAASFADVDRCARTGDVLRGGNTFVHVIKPKAPAATPPASPSHDLVDQFARLTDSVFTLGDAGGLPVDFETIASVERTMAGILERLVHYCGTYGAPGEVDAVVDRYLDARAELVRLRTPAGCAL